MAVGLYVYALLAVMIIPLAFLLSYIASSIVGVIFILLVCFGFYRIAKKDPARAERYVLKAISISAWLLTAVFVVLALGAPALLLLAIPCGMVGYRTWNINPNKPAA